MYPFKKSVMNKFIIYLKKPVFCFIILFTVVTSCKKLDETPKSFVTPENFYTTPAQVEAAFAASMNNLWEYWGGYV